MQAGDEPGIIFDAHCDTATRLAGDSDIDLGKRLSDGHIDIPRMNEAGVNAQVFACWVDPDLSPDSWLGYTADMVSRLHDQADRNSAGMEVALSGSDIVRITGSGKIAAVIGVEGGHAIGANMKALHALYERGVRCLTLTWNNHNEIADSSEGTGRWGGLSPFGSDVIGEMDRIGMVIDCSHSSDATFYDVLETSANPVLLSHSCMKAICGHPRNATDDMLKALAEREGVVGINFFPGFLEKECSDRIFSLWDRYKEERSRLADRYGGDSKRADGEILDGYMKQLKEIPVPGISTVVDHIEHAVEVAGIEHVGLGSDFDGTPLMPEGLKDVTGIPGIAVELERRGYEPEDIERILGLNLLRLFEAVTG